MHAPGTQSWSATRRSWGAGCGGHRRGRHRPPPSPLAPPPLPAAAARGAELLPWRSLGVKRAGLQREGQRGRGTLRTGSARRAGLLGRSWSGTAPPAAALQHLGCTQASSGATVVRAHGWGLGRRRGARTGPGALAEPGRGAEQGRIEPWQSWAEGRGQLAAARRLQFWEPVLEGRPSAVHEISGERPLLYTTLRCLELAPHQALCWRHQGPRLCTAHAHSMFRLHEQRSAPRRRTSMHVHRMCPTCSPQSCQSRASPRAAQEPGRVVASTNPIACHRRSVHERRRAAVAARAPISALALPAARGAVPGGLPCRAAPAKRCSACLRIDGGAGMACGSRHED